LPVEKRGVMLLCGSAIYPDGVGFLVGLGGCKNRKGADCNTERLLFWVKPNLGY